MRAFVGHAQTFLICGLNRFLSRIANTSLQAQVVSGPCVAATLRARAVGNVDAHRETASSRSPGRTGRDNVFVERLWRSVKYEEVYLRAYDSVSEARASLGRYLDFYNSRRPHSSLDGMTPDQAYCPLSLSLRLAA